MKSIATNSLFLAAIALGFAGCKNSEFTHVKPGHSARLEYYARTAQPPASVKLPAPPPGQQPALGATPGAMGPVGPLPDIPIDPALPEASNVANRVADAYTRGNFAMQAGQTNEAILAFEEAVDLDPAFTDAWTKLAILYQKVGKNDKAAEAYKRVKKLGQPEGSSLGPTPTGVGLIPS